MSAGTEGAASGEFARTAGLAASATTFHLDWLRLARLAHRQRCGPLCATNAVNSVAQEEPQRQLEAP